MAEGHAARALYRMCQFGFQCFESRQSLQTHISDVSIRVSVLPDLRVSESTDPTKSSMLKPVKELLDYNNCSIY